MSVFVLFHADIEDDRNVRAVYATRELAEAALTRPDVEIVEHNDNCKACTGRHVYWRTHSDACCSVDEWPILDALPADEPEPETPWVDDPANRMVPDSWLMDVATFQRLSHWINTPPKDADGRYIEVKTG